MIVESHSHINLELPGFEESKPWYGRAIEGITQYLDSYDQNNVDAGWVFPGKAFLDSELIPAENTALSKLHEKYPNRLFPWGIVNSNWPEGRLRGEIRRIASELQLFGIKLIPITQGIPLTSPGMDIVAEEAHNAGLPVFFHDGSAEYCSAIQIAWFARKHPGLRVVSGHGGLREMWPDYVWTAGKIPNLWICLSGPTQWGIQKLYDALGPKRLLWGSDGGIGSPAVIKAYLRRIERLNAPEEHKKMILGENAMRFLFGENWKESRKNNV